MRYNSQRGRVCREYWPTAVTAKRDLYGQCPKTERLTPEAVHEPRLMVSYAGRANPNSAKDLFGLMPVPTIPRHSRL